MASAAFNTCYAFTANFYPTNVRNFAFTFISCIGNIGINYSFNFCGIFYFITFIGAFVSPQVNLSKNLWKPLPYLIFSSFSLLGSIAIFLLSRLKHSNN